MKKIASFVLALVMLLCCVTANASSYSMGMDVFTFYYCYLDACEMIDYEPDMPSPVFSMKMGPDGMYKDDAMMIMFDLSSFDIKTILIDNAEDPYANRQIKAVIIATWIMTGSLPYGISDSEMNRMLDDLVVEIRNATQDSPCTIGGYDFFATDTGIMAMW